MNGQNNTNLQNAEPCSPGCNCGKPGFSSRMKWAVCGVVTLAAAVTVTAHIARNRADNNQSKTQKYTVTIPGGTLVEKTKPTVSDSNTWGSPLNNLAELNVVASNTEAVFLVLLSDDSGRTAAVQKEVSTAASTIIARGIKMGTFLLSKDSEEYKGISKQVGAPAVLALYKGRGMAAVQDKEITQDGLLKAFVGASRPSGCGPSGCGPGSPGCP